MSNKFATLCIIGTVLSQRVSASSVGKGQSLSQLSAQTSTKSFTQIKALCNPVYVGELRVKQTKLCVDISGYSGEGSVATYSCDGGADQVLKWCDDGTIRNTAGNFCFTQHGTGQLTSSICDYFGSGSAQKWTVGNRKTFTDNGGIMQTAFEIKNIATGQCMDVAGYSGSGSIGAYGCENKDDQFFYFRQRGKVLGSGTLIVENSRQCVDVAGYSGSGNIATYNCDGGEDQFWAYYQNGEIVNQKSGLCLDVAGYSGSGDVATWYCEDALDQMWDTPLQLRVNGHDSFRNKQSGQCIDVAGWNGYGEIATYTCDGNPDQRFYFQKTEWTTPSVSWGLVGCNQNGGVQFSITSSYSYETSLTAGMEISIGTTIEAGTAFGGVSMSMSATASLSNTWTSSSTDSNTLSVSCDSYDNGQAFIGGCLWQMKMTTSNTSGKSLSWSPSIVKCTASNIAPKCPPFSICADAACTFCQSQ